MKPVDDWRRIVRYAWSLRLAVLAALLGGAEVALPLFSDAVPRNVFLFLSMVVSLAAAVSRIVAQPRIRDGE